MLLTKVTGQDFANIIRIGNSVDISGTKISIDLDAEYPCYQAIADNIAPVAKQRFDSWLFSTHKSIKNFEQHLYKNQSNSMLKHNFLVRDDKDKLIIYRRKSKDSNELTYVSNTKSYGWLDAMLHDVEMIAKDANFYGKSAYQAKKELKMAVIDQTYERITEPIAQISNNPQEYCYAYIPLDRLCTDNRNIKTPAWDNFVFQFEHQEEQELFMAYVYSIFKSDNFGRQICWLQGQGLSGKSTIARTIYNVMKSFDDKLAQAKENRINLSQFSYSQLDQSRLVVLTETKDRGLLQDAQTLQLTGNDVALINQKWKETFSKQIYSKLIVCSNLSPIVNLYAKHEMTRLLYLKLNDELCNQREAYWSNTYPDLNWKNELRKEFWGFMYKCKEHYFNRIKPDDNFDIPDIITAKVKANCVDEISASVEMFFKSGIKLKNNSKLSLVQIFDKYCHFMSVRNINHAMKNAISNYIKGNKLPYKECVVNGVELKYIEGYAFVEKTPTYKSLTLEMIK